MVQVKQQDLCKPFSYKYHIHFKSHAAEVQTFSRVQDMARHLHKQQALDQLSPEWDKVKCNKEQETSSTKW